MEEVDNPEPSLEGAAGEGTSLKKRNETGNESRRAKVDAGRDLSESLLINLIDNAVKAGKEGDSIILGGHGGRNQRH